MDKNELYLIVATLLAKESQIKLGDIDANRHLAFYGLGSLQAISLTGEINKALKIKLDFTELIEHKNLKSIVDFLYQEKKANLASSQVFFTENTLFESTQFLAIQQQLNQYKGSSLYFDEIEGLPERKVLIDSQLYLNFSSYNYLGFAHDDEIINASIDAIRQYGTSASASRLVGGQRAIHRELEEHLANFLNTEDALIFNSGHATNVTTIGHLFDCKDLIILDELSHNSLIQGAQLSKATIKFFKHNNASSLANLLEENSIDYAKTLVVTEGVFSMDGDIPPLEDYIHLKEKYNFFLYVDEAHSLGVLGEKGAGIGEHYAIKPNLVDIWMGTLSKAMASIGGYIAGSKNLISYLRHSAPGFVYSCGLSPADTAAALAALQKLKKASERVKHLHDLSSYLLHLLKQQGINTGQSKNTPIIPIIIGDSNLTVKLSKALRQKHIYLHAIVSPVVPEREARLRVFVNYHHRVEDLDYLVKNLVIEMKKIIPF